MTSESDTTVFVCVYGRHKPGKVRPEFKFDGKIFLTGREMTLVDDETKEAYVLTLNPNIFASSFLVDRQTGQP